jgi:NADPH-dependent curcumin reductase CurA
MVSTHFAIQTAGPDLVIRIYCSLLTFIRHTDVRSYVPPVQVGEIMRGITVGVVKASKSQKFPVGSHAIGTVGWTEMAVVKDKQLERVDIPLNGKLTDFLGILGKDPNFLH